MAIRPALPRVRCAFADRHGPHRIAHETDHGIRPSPSSGSARQAAAQCPPILGQGGLVGHGAVRQPPGEPARALSEAWRVSPQCGHGQQGRGPMTRPAEPRRSAQLNQDLGASPISTRTEMCRRLPLDLVGLAQRALRPLQRLDPAPRSSARLARRRAAHAAGEPLPTRRVTRATAARTGVANSLSIRRPSRSTTSKRQPCASTTSPTGGRWPAAASTKPAAVW